MAVLTNPSAEREAARAAAERRRLRKTPARDILVDATRRRLSLPFRLWLWIEMIAIFVAAPLIAEIIVFGYGVPLFIVLGGLFFLIGLLLTIDPLPIWRAVGSTLPSFGQLVHILALFLILGSCIGLYVHIYETWRFLNFPMRRPEVYQMVMIGYPVLSVVAQELMYRVFFFERYAVIFGRHVWLLILVNGALFGYAHILFNNWLAVILTGIGGVIFAWRYHVTRSFYAVWLEHSLYGAAVFTFGLGHYFFTGVSNLRGGGLAMPGWWPF